MSTADRVIVFDETTLRRWDPVMQQWLRTEVFDRWHDLLIEGIDERTGHEVKIHLKNQRNGQSWFGGRS